MYMSAKAGGFAKFWIEPLELEYAYRLKVTEIARAQELIQAHRDLIIERWNEAFGH